MQQKDMLDERVFAQLDQSEVRTCLAASIPGVSRLSSADADFFRGLFRKEELCYAHSWLYLLRAARDDQGSLGYKFVSDGMIAGVGYRDHSFHIVRPMGTRRYNELVDLCRKIRRISRRPIILKKVDQVLYEQLMETQPFFTEGGHLELFEEEAFPEHIIQLERLFAPPAEVRPRLQPFLKKVQRFERQTRLWSVQNVTWAELESNPGFQSVLGSHPDKYKSYAQILRDAVSTQKESGRYRFCAYYDERGIVHGLYVSELFRKGIMGLYCAVSARSFPGITEWMDYDFFQQLFREGIHTLYLGGSETEGVHGYVQKLLPVVPTYLMRPLLIL